MDNENLSVICREITMRIHNKILSRSLSCKDEDRVRILAAQMVEIEEKQYCSGLGQEREEKFMLQTLRTVKYGHYHCVQVSLSSLFPCYECPSSFPSSCMNLCVSFFLNPNYFICVHDFLSQIQYHVDQMGDSLTQTQKQELMNYIQFLANNCRDPRRRG
ncbi:hypothetical protein DERP_014195 [Dermatophagoides pteronyssinus]|uniref:Uncharacterized protein n=1 Tax=Dermatophagoides pteronyssinus TaxID=6956 RepID=A0ABQ8IWM0_DERPT|nr:hypothetical protein DERP_014195 [Dermatophagoides pteronyssinus]